MSELSAPKGALGSSDTGIGSGTLKASSAPRQIHSRGGGEKEVGGSNSVSFERRVEGGSGGYNHVVGGDDSSATGEVTADKNSVTGISSSSKAKSLKKAHTAPSGVLAASLSSINRLELSDGLNGAGSLKPDGNGKEDGVSSGQQPSKDNSNSISNSNMVGTGTVAPRSLVSSASISGLAKSSNSMIIQGQKSNELPPLPSHIRSSENKRGHLHSNSSSLTVKTSNLSRSSSGQMGGLRTTTPSALGGGLTPGVSSSPSNKVDRSSTTPSNLNMNSAAGNPFSMMMGLGSRHGSEKDNLLLLDPTYGRKSLSRTGSRGALMSRSGYPRRQTYDDILVEPWCLHFMFDPEKLLFPKKVLYDDFLGKWPRELLDISNWKCSPSVFALIKETCRPIKEFRGDYTNIKNQLLTYDNLQAIRGFPNLRLVSLKGAITVTDDVAKCLGSLKELKELDLSENQLCDVALSIMSQSCSSLRSLKLRQCTNLTDVGMTFIASHIIRFRKLSELDFAGCKSFTDEGSLQVLTAAPMVLSSVSFNGCPQVTSLTMTACRQKLQALTHLNLAKTFLGQSCFEWISEGCRNMVHIDLTNCFELDSIGLQMIGRKCPKLKFVKLDNCCKFSDVDMEVFFTEVSLNENSLEVFSINGCIHCGDKAVLAAANVNSSTLREIYLNGLCHISGHSLEVFLQKCSSLVIFEMSLNGDHKVAITHRQSVLPHISDDALTNIGCLHLAKFNIAGSALITDFGVSSLVKRCVKLKYLDISYCNQITDASLVAISEHLYQIDYLNVSGNINVSNDGIMAIASGGGSNGSSSSLQHIEFNGCSKVTDDGVRSLAQLPNLKSLHIRGCVYVGNASLEVIARACPNLKVLDISSLDLVTIDAVKLFIECCSFITTLNCEGCSFTAREFSLVVKDRLPLAEWGIPNCKLQPRPPTVANFNRYVIKLRDYDRAAIPIQKLIRVICFRNWMFRANKAKNRAARLIEKIYKKWMRKKAKVAREKVKYVKRDSTVVIQRWARRRISIIFAQKKLSKLRIIDRARRDIQRVFRGHMGRKRCRRLFSKLYVWYTKIGRLVHKYWVVTAARRLHRYICTAQAVARMFLWKRRFLRARKGVRALELVVLTRIRRNTDCRLCLNSLVDLIVLRDNKAKVMQRNLKACLFNKQLSPFVLISCIYYRTEFDRNTWNQLILARYWRGFIIRLNNWRRKMRPTWEHDASVKIQCQVRMRQARRVRRNKILKLRKNMFRWKRFVIKRPRLRICEVLKVIQRAYKQHFIWKRIHTFVSRIQKIFRGWKTRVWYKKMRWERVERASGIIARKYRRYKAYFKRKERMAIEHMKCWKIQRWIKRKLNAEALRRIQAAKAANRRKKEKEEKEKLQEKKRYKYVANLRMMFHNRYASRIQRVYRKWFKEKTKKRQAMLNRKKALEEAKEEIAEMRLERAAFSFALNPVQMFRDFSWYVSNTFSAHGLNFGGKDKTKLQTAILTQQAATILQEGIIDMHMTWGLIEKRNFTMTQELDRKAGRPHFTRIDADVSGKLNLHVYLWTMHGVGKECICQLEVKERPPTSLTATRSRVDDARGKGIKIAWHPDVHLEIQGHCTIKQNKGGYSIEDIKVVFTAEEGELLKEKGYLRVANLTSLGFFSTIWTFAKIPDDNPELFKQPTLNVRTWADKRLLRVAKSFNLLESEILIMRKSYESILGVRIAESLSFQEMAVHFGLPYTQMFKWACKAVGPEKGSEVSFSEYVHIVAYFSMFTRTELIKFLFGQMDPEQKGYLTKEGWEKFCDILAEEGPYNPSPWKKQFEAWYDKKLKMIFCAQFDKFSASFPQSLWAAQEMQKKIKTFNLGEMFWERKMNQYRIIRQEAGVKLIK